MWSYVPAFQNRNVVTLTRYCWTTTMISLLVAFARNSEILTVLASSNNKIQLLSLSYVRALFDIVVEHHPKSANSLSWDAKFLENKAFENWILKPRRRQLHDLSAKKPQIVKRSKVQKWILGQEDSSIFLADKSLHKFNATPIHVESYIDTWFIVPTTKKLKRLLLPCRHAVIDNRSQLSPTNLELQLILFSNRRL